MFVIVIKMSLLSSTFLHPERILINSKPGGAVGVVRNSSKRINVLTPVSDGRLQNRESLKPESSLVSN